MIQPAVTQDQKAMLITYLADKLGEPAENLVGQMPYEAAAISRDGRFAGAVLYTNFRGTSIEMCWAGEPGWATREHLRAIFAYPFLQLGCLRASGCVRRSNSASREFCKKIGCREVGVLEHEYGPGDDGILYTITRDKCRWIKPRNAKTNGKHRHG